jgi:hypothetical protein
LSCDERRALLRIPLPELEAAARAADDAQLRGGGGGGGGGAVDALRAALQRRRTRGSWRQWNCLLPPLARADDDDDDDDDAAGGAPDAPCVFFTSPCGLRAWLNERLAEEELLPLRSASEECAAEAALTLRLRAALSAQSLREDDSGLAALMADLRTTPGDVARPLLLSSSSATQLHAEQGAALACTLPRRTARAHGPHARHSRSARRACLCLVLTPASLPVFGFGFRVCSSQFWQWRR